MASIDHKTFFGVVGKAVSGEFGADFKSNPCVETRDAILDNLKSILDKLIRGAGKSGGKKATVTEKPVKRTVGGKKPVAKTKEAAKPVAKTKEAAKPASKKPVAKAAGGKSALAKQFPVGTRVRVVKQDGTKFVGAVGKHKVNGATAETREGNEYGRFTQMTALVKKG